MKRSLLFLAVTALLLPGLGAAAQCCGAVKAQAANGNGNGGALAPATVDTWTVATLLRARVPAVILDARAGAKERLPGAKVLSPAEATPERLAQVVGAKDRLVVTYCAGPRCSLSTQLAAKLRAAGYTNVLEYREGWAGWAKWKAHCAAKLAGKSQGACPVMGQGAGEAGCPEAGQGPCQACPGKGKGVPVAAVDTAALAALLRAKVPVVLVDARAGKYDDGRRIPGARALKCLDCVEKPAALAKLAGPKDRLVVTYCSGGKCPLAAKAARALRAAGYTNVLVYRDGITGWTRAGLKVVSGEAECCGLCEGGGPCEKTGGCQKKDGGACEKGGRCGVKPKAKRL